MYRLIKPGGIIAVRDPDFSLLFCEPATRLLHQPSDLILKVREFKGGSPYYAKRLRSLLQEAGFSKTQGFAFINYQGEAEAINEFASALIEVLLNPANMDVAAAQGWADRATIEAMAAEIRAWSEKPDAFHGNLDCAAIGWKYFDK